jgi:hypothetical protein
MLRFTGRGIVALIAALSATPVFAQAANFASLSLAPGFPAGAGVVSGNTSGSYSLSSISNRDRKNNPCIGFGAETPDHIMTLERDFSNLTVQVKTRGKDTTLLIQGPINSPNQSVRCGDDTGSSKDASVQDTNWKAGQYRVWVGSIDPRRKWNYLLTVRQ